VAGQLNDDDLKEFVALQSKFKDSENSWAVDAKSIDKTTYELSVKSPNKADETELRDPKDIIAEIAALKTLERGCEKSASKASFS
jgi:type I restriction enzyme M protein